MDKAMAWLQDLAQRPNLQEHEFAVAILATLSAALKDRERLDTLRRLFRESASEDISTDRVRASVTVTRYMSRGDGGAIPSAEALDTAFNAILDQARGQT